MVSSPSRHDELDTYDNDDNPLFQRCVDLWGPLAENEMFTFAPYPLLATARRWMQFVRQIFIY